MKLGRKPPIPGLRVPALDDHLKRAMPPPPVSVDWYSKVGPQWVLGHNDQYGDCTIAASANAILGWTANGGSAFRVSDDAVLARYAALTGFDPAKPSTDMGAVETDVLGRWSASGWDVGGQTGDTMLWAAVNPADLAAVKSTINLFGGIYIGLALPLSAQDQVLWNVPATGPNKGAGAPGSWGGHAVWVAGYDQSGPVLVTWGAVKRATWRFWQEYCDEAYALFSRLHWNLPDGHSPGHVDTEALAANLAAMRPA
jgi:hypothetical protein